MAETPQFRNPLKITTLSDGTMQVENPAITTIPHDWNIIKLLLNRVERNPRGTVIERKIGLGSEWQKLAAQDFLTEVDTVARGLFALGLRPGGRMATMAHTSYEWTLLDYACWSVGAANVPIYETSSLTQIGNILRESGVRLVFTEDARLAEAVRIAATQEKLEVRVLALDLGAINALQEASRTVAQAEVDRAREQLTLDSEATIIYTSGTSGTPKGTVLTHGNFTQLVWQNQDWMPEFSKDPRARLLLFLPLAHVYARLLEVFIISGNGTLGHTPSIKNLLPDIQSFHPTYLLVVPRVLEKIYNSADAQAATSKPKHIIFKRAVRCALDYSRALDTPQGPTRWLRVRHAFYEQVVYRKLMNLLGGRCEFVISGGGALGLHLSHFYRGIGLNVLEGYGLTESTAPIAVNTMRQKKIGTVGPPVVSATIRVTPDGEILAKGPTVSPGYLNPEHNEGIFDTDGFMHTGDLGHLDVNGMLSITGRAKEILVTAGGKNVVPATLEGPLQSHPLISQIMIVGEGRPFVGALVTLDLEMLPSWLKKHNLPAMDVSTASRHPVVLDAIKRAIDRANQGVSRAESIREFRVLPYDFTEANSMLTPSMKVRRKVVMEKCAAEIEDIYAGIHDAQVEGSSGNGGSVRGMMDPSKVTGYLRSMLGLSNND